MTLPLSALAQNPYDENDASVPAWRKAALKLAQQQQNTQTVANSPYSSTAQTDPIGQLTTGLQTVDQMGKSATAGAQGAAATRQNYYNKYQQDLFNYNQAKAQAAFQQAAQAQIDEMKKQYQQQINNPTQGSQYTTPDQFVTPGNGTTGSNQKVQYTGQAAQVAQLARNAGFPESVIPQVVAISQAESSGDATAQHKNSDSYGSTDLGLMQINDHWHADLLSKYNWQDPQQNMSMAYQIWKDAGGSFSPWSTYNSGAYEQYMGVGKSAASAIVPNTTPYVASAQTSSGLRQAIISKGETYIGLPYVWGGTDLSKGVDCSGLVQQVYAKFGINLPRTSAEQYTGHIGNTTYGVQTTLNHLEPGDLVFWKTDQGVVHHVAIWLGNNQILESPHTGATVHIKTLSSYDRPYGLHLYGLDPAQPTPQQGTAKSGANAAT